ncbi:MAG: ribosome maturation factor RimM [Chloroflexi bacterium]|nr:ribosome maturation factor RimM [Chloroflexota bacterium]
MTRSERTQAPDAIPDDHVVVGEIIGAWGLRGDVKVQTHSDYPDRFIPGSSVYLGNERCVIVRVHKHKVGFVVGFDGVSDRTAAELLRGKTLTVPSSELPGLDDGTFFYFDIIDMAVHTSNGDELGRIEEIISAGGNDVYVVRGTGKEILIPAARDYVVEVDVKRGIMTVSLPDGYPD